ncbi:MAG: acyltransferase [Hyphomicrobiaceae bacterium]|nr:acyltransferase [Hyphomicrobiaceae bacterium]
MSLLANKVAKLRRWVKSQDSPAANAIYRIAKGARGISIPSVRAIHSPLYMLHRATQMAFANAKRAIWVTPLFQSQLQAPAPRLNLYGTLPFIQGNVTMTIGADCRIGGRTNFAGRTASHPTPEIIIGNNCDIGFMNVLSCGSRIHIGNNVRLAAYVQLVGYPGHPIDVDARALGAPDTDDQVGDIILEDDVWLATRVTVNRGVRIGRGTIVATGSVVTSDLPPFVLAAGIPARIIKNLPQPNTHAALPTKASAPQAA